MLAGANDLNYQRLLAYLDGTKVDVSPLDFAFFVRRINPIFNDVNAVEAGAQGRSCSDATACPMHFKWIPVKKKIIAMLQEMTLEELAKAVRTGKYRLADLPAAALPA